MSEQILLLNRRSRRKYRHATNRRRRRVTNRRRRKNPMPRALRHYWATHRHKHNRRRSRRRYVPRTNRHMRRRRTNRRKYRHARRHHTNPRFRMPQFGRGTLGRIVTPALIGAAGGVALDVAWGYLSPKIVPANFQTGWAGFGAKLAVLFGGAWAVNRFLLKSPRQRLMTHRAVMGATTVLTYGALKGLLQSVAPSVPGLSGYIDYHSYALPGTRMAGYMPRASALGSLEDLYSPAAVIQPPGTAVPRQFGGYIAAQPGLSGYMQPHTAGGGGLMGYDWQHDGM
jgi:hypothetical protein